MAPVHSAAERVTPDPTTSRGASEQRRRSPRVPRRRGVVLGTALVVGVLLAVIGVVAVVSTRNTGDDAGTAAVWSDSFSGPAGAAPNTSNWLLTTGTAYPGGAAQWGTGEVETYTADRSNASLDGHGHLRITASRNSAGQWQSARLETRRTDFQPARGGRLRVEARIRTPSGGNGYWPAFWMLGAPYRGVYTNWPGVGEIDIMENKGSEPATVHGTLHCGVNPGGPCAETNGISASYVNRTAPAPLSSGFHTYAVEWNRSAPIETITWSVDGHSYLTVKANDVDSATWAAATHHGFFILLNLAIGGSFPGPTDATTRPSASMLIDYVRVSRR